MEDRQEIFEAMKKRIAIIINKKEEELLEDTKFADLNMKSLNYSQLTTYLEDECDVEIAFMDFKRKATLGEATDYVISLIED
ncbi:MAG: phosphopantetheine-binding protein [Clostridiales bacterium]